MDKEKLVEFLGSRLLTNELKKEFKNREKKLHGNFYRGMPYPKHLLKVGTIIEEWHGSSHFSISEEIAKNFAIFNINGYINEDYYEELQEELQIEDVEFVQLVLVANDLIGVEMYKLLKEIGETERFIDEKEITTFDKNFLITDIEEKNVNNEKLYYAKIKMIGENL